MTSTATVASLVVAVVGLLLFWANPRRRVNRAVFGSSAIVATWLAFGHLAATQMEDGLFWLRWTYAIGALAPLSLWSVKESIVGDFNLHASLMLRRSVIWLLIAIVLMIIPFTDWFIPSHSSETERIRGLGYYLYFVGLVGAYAKLLHDSVRLMPSLTGAKKLELQVWLLGGCIVATLIYILIGLGALTHEAIYRKIQPIVILVFYAGTAYAITSHRIFDARQILLVCLEKAILVSCAALFALIVNRVLDVVISETVSLLVTVTVVLATAGWLNGWLDRQFQFMPPGGAARQAAFAIAQRENRPESLEAAFRGLLKGWGQSENAVILSGTKDTLSGMGFQLEVFGPVVSTLKELRWATPERLVRERLTSGRRALKDFLDKADLGVVVIEEGPALTLVIGIGVGASRRPYTYPQVLQLMELAAIIQAAFERVHFSTKAQHAEQLATVGLLGASLAHEIRNPLVSIKTFIQLLPDHYGDSRFRDKFFRLISDEVGRIDQLTEQLLDLASPRAYVAQEVELHPLLKSSMDLVAAKAAHRRVELITDFQAAPDRAVTDASAAKQVVINLCFNAIQAVESVDLPEKWVKVSTRNVPKGIEMAVADSGPGIAPDIRSRLFQPFQTTKSTGFGLGLAICNDILTNLEASISVDPSEPGRGATFRVIFPCQLS
jgi:signal transduction histidine kinase